ncbi:serine aminopeptidase domain-containing protein [Streptomyces fragilis]|uniref:Alpha/beta hydrolase n=1 Tax=Streptomyces fragilis TaxID=67301 RepID=A0ABV2YNL6_9ACTN|nr:alpha/beta hydrolase [Streptomyces fragilis]
MIAEEPPAALTAFRRLNDEVFRCYEEGRLEDGIRLLRTPPPPTLPWRAELAYLLACLQGAAGRPGEALETLREALTAGGWWDPAVLDGEEDFAEVRRLPAFAALREESAGRWREALRMTRDHDVLVRPDALPARGLLLALHGAEESEQDALRAWRPALEVGFAVLAVRSSWRTSPRYRTWPRTPWALEEVDAAVAAHAGEVAGLPLTVAGFSAGGRVALQWALSRGPREVAGVVAVAPAISVEELPGSPRLPERAHLVVGARDDLLDDVREVAGRLAGCRLDVVEGAGHEVPADAIRRALA